MSIPSRGRIQTTDILPQSLSRVIGICFFELLYKLPALFVQPRGDIYLHDDIFVRPYQMPPSRIQSLALYPELVAALDTGRQFYLRKSVYCGHAHLRAERRLANCYRQVEVHIVVDPAEVLVRRDLYCYVEVAGPSSAHTR